MREGARWGAAQATAGGGHGPTDQPSTRRPFPRMHDGPRRKATAIASPEASTSPADRTYRLVDLRLFAVDGGIGAEQWSLLGAIANAV
jgi:hypothetical protein